MTAMPARTIAIVLLLAVTHAEVSAAQDRYAAERARMVAEISAMARETGVATGRPRLSDAVMTAMGRVPRHRFVPVLHEGSAYENRPLPIGEGQTISQPFVVALMTDMLDPKPGHTALEVGTGSGYQAAVLAELVAKVYTIEIVEPLGRRAMKLLEQLGYRNVQVRIGDGYNGWPEAAPFDAIVVTAAPAEIPKPLID
jgi:protein-L-isoaspartate(D-aspartate) O-methyltransferase